MDLFLLLLALFGHALFWIGWVNRLHALGMWRPLVHLSTVVCFFCMAAIPVSVGILFYINIPQRPTTASWGGLPANVTWTLIGYYLLVCWIVAAVTLIRSAWFLVLHHAPAPVRFCGRRHAAIDLKSAAINEADNRHHFLAHLPFNEILRLDVSEWTIELPQLAPALDGLSIVHLSDSHLTGKIGKAFFREVVRTSNELKPDLVVLTGDLVDARACIDWIPDTLGRLSARYGVFFVLGNHDLLTRDVARLRKVLEQCGFIDLGGRTVPIEINGQPILLTGNERPWIRDEASPAACGFAGDSHPLRIALSHSPDQLLWARSQTVDLLFAGHTHGGQIRIPPLGAIFSPSLWGVKHISGIYHLPPTIMHVTRGLSGCTPIRWLCPPEVARLTLRAAAR
jgi:uncharacterized protein